MIPEVVPQGTYHGSLDDLDKAADEFAYMGFLRQRLSVLLGLTNELAHVGNKWIVALFGRAPPRLFGFAAHRRFSFG